VRDETSDRSWRDISSPGTMACEFFKVSPCTSSFMIDGLFREERDTFDMYRLP
jgi:hypothetical protein